MTRREFDEIESWDELIDFCRDYDIEDVIESIYTDDEDVVEYLMYELRNNSAYSALDAVKNAVYHLNPRAYYHRLVDGMFLEADDEDFEALKSDAMRQFLAYNDWEDEDVDSELWYGEGTESDTDEDDIDTEAWTRLMQQ